MLGIHSPAPTADHDPELGLVVELLGHVAFDQDWIVRRGDRLARLEEELRLVDLDWRLLGQMIAVVLAGAEDDRRAERRVELHVGQRTPVSSRAHEVDRCRNRGIKPGDVGDERAVALDDRSPPLAA